MHTDRFVLGSVFVPTDTNTPSYYSGVHFASYLGILGLKGAINCILAQTSHQKTTSEKRTKALLPKCPLFGGSTI